MARIVLGVSAALALAGCATEPYPMATPAPEVAPPAPAPSIYDGAPAAVARNELLVCSPLDSNLGPVGADNQSLEYTPYIQTAAGALLRVPTEQACLSSGFGYRTTIGTGSAHTGIDLANPNGGFVFAAGDGWVASEDYRGGYGLVLELDHGRSVHTLYAHLNEIDPRLHPGVFVHAGQAVARMGRTGNATGVHLHYELIVDGVKEDPLAYGTPYQTAPLAPGAQVTEVGEPAPADNALGAPPAQASAPDAAPEALPDTSGDQTPACDPNAAYDPNGACAEAPEQAPPKP
jgi:murein DD-endopeptidase MepM/ murein hydrolase activator NlpD